MKIALIYPPGGVYQRGEDRCQANIDTSTATSMRACNDLGYAAAILLKEKHEVIIRDYQTERKSINDAIEELKDFSPEIIFLSTTNATIFEDIKILKQIKEEISFKGKIILKGAIFFDADNKMLELLDLNDIDVLIGGETEFCIEDIVKAFNNEIDFNKIDNIFYKDENGVFVKNRFKISDKDLDTIPFPARHLMNNDLYTRPDTGEKMATIQTSRGCPSNCIYCLSPKISGKMVRFRSPQNVLEELKECYEKYDIKNFFFKADTFTINPKWTIELCDLIVNSNLNNKIEFTANSRVKPISEELLIAMKKAGCFAIAFGFETGNEDTMKKIGKGVTVEDNYKAMELAKKVGLTTYGFYMIGFPWEDKKQIKDTEKLINKLNSDFLEVHIALPYYGTRLYDMCEESGVLAETILGIDYFNTTTTGTEYLKFEELMNIRKKIISRYYMRPTYILKKLWAARKQPKVIKNYILYGLRLIKNLF